MAEKLVSAIPFNTLPDSPKVLEIGCGTGFVTELLAQKTSPAKYIAVDIIPEAETTVQRIFNNKSTAQFIQADASKLEEFPMHPDLFVSGATIQWIENLPVFFQKVAHCLSEDGIVAFSTFGPDNFKEIAAVEGVTLKYYTLADIEAMLHPHFHIVSSAEEEHTQYFPTAIEVLKHIKQSGVNSVSSQPWTRNKLANFERSYTDNFTTPQGVSLTYNPQYIIAKKR